ncbi:CynX/NimT family MFS transporter [Dyella sp.]|uniref:MFS transporter n=1 Tax=Dyella sp. TaxID=1869338 RepID=UPI002F92972D
MSRYEQSTAILDAKDNSGLTLAAGIACIVLVAIDLRPAIVSVGPLLGQIRGEFGISNAQASLLTAIPNLLMGLLALPAPWLARRLGRDRVILAALAVLSIATLLRAFVETTTQLMVTTAGVGAGIAVAGALISGFVKARFPQQVPLLMGLYAMSIGLGSTLAAAATAPLAALGGWRLGTGVWALPGLTAIAAWWVVSRSEGIGLAPVSAVARAHRHPLGRASAWLVAVYFATNNFLFFGFLSWIAPMFRELGATQAYAGMLLASFTMAFMLSNPLPALLSRREDRRRLIGLFAGIALVGLLVIAVAPTFMPLVAIPMAACGVGASFSLGMTLPLDNASSPDEANSWTSFVLFVGYLLGALGPLTLGFLRDRTGSFQAGLWTLVAAAALMASLAPSLSPARRHRKLQRAEGSATERSYDARATRTG